MSLNTDSTVGLLGGHTWRYGAFTGLATVEITVANGENTGGWLDEHAGKHLRLTQEVNGETVTENFIYCRGDGGSPYAGTTGDIVAVNDSVGHSRTSKVKGVAVVVHAAGDQNKDGVILDRFRIAMVSPNCRLNLTASITDITGTPVTLTVTNGSGTGDNSFVVAYTYADPPAAHDNLIPLVGNYGGETGDVDFSGGKGLFYSPKGKLIKIGLDINGATGSNEKAGLTTVNNSTALASPTTADSNFQRTRAKVLARAFLAYKKKKK